MTHHETVAAALLAFALLSLSWPLLVRLVRRQAPVAIPAAEEV